MEVIFNKLDYVDKSSSSKKVYLSDINVVMKTGSIISFIGEEANIIGELLLVIKRPSKGEIIIDKTIIKRTSHVSDINEIRKRIGYLRNDDTSFLGKSVKEEIKNVMKNYKFKTSNVTKHIVDSLKIVGLDETYLERDPNKLSYTEKKKVKLASLMSYNPEILILEEFDKGMIFRDKEYFRKLFLKLKNKFKKTIILINSDLTFLFELVDNLYVINKSKLVINDDKYVFYDDKLYNYVEVPKIVDFTKYAQSQGHNILEYTDLKELIKELYRNVK